MTARPDAVREADVVVLGAGAAGLSVALGLAGRRVDLLAKGPLGRTGNSPLAQGGVACAVGPGDSPALQAADTLAVAGELADPGAVARLTEEGPERLAQLLALGARFDRDAAGQLDLAREAAHSRARVLHARDATGAEVVRALGQALAERSGLSVFERSFALDLVLDGGRLAGVLARHADGAACSTAPARSCSPPAASAASSRGRRTRRRPPGTASPSPGAPARGSPTSSSSSSTRPRSTWAPTRCRSSPRRCAAPGPSSWTRTADGSWPTPVRRASCCPATSSPARCGPRSPRGAARSWTRARRWGSRSPSGSRPCSRPAGGTASTRAWSRSPWPRPRTTTWAAWTWTSTGGRASPACGPRARWRAPGSTARTAWPATRCSRPSSSARASHGASPRPCPT